MLILGKGYTVSNLTKREAAREGLLEQLAPVTDVAALRAAIQEAQANKGVVIKVKHKKQVVGCLIFRREETELTTLIGQHPEAAEEITLKPDKEGNVPTTVTVLRLTERCVLPEHDEAIAAIEREESTLREAGMLYIDTKVRAVLWGDECVTAKTVDVGGFNATGYLLGFVLGFCCFGVAMGNIALGVSFGACFALLFGVVFARSGKDKKDEKDKE